MTRTTQSVFFKGGLFLLLISLVTACHGSRLGGSGTSGVGGGENGSLIDSSESEESTTTDDPTQFRPTSLPPAIDDPSYTITANLTLKGTAATVTTWTTFVDSDEPAAGVTVNFVHTRFIETESLASEKESSSLQAVALSSGGKKFKVTELATVQVKADGSGMAMASFADFNPESDVVYAAVIGETEEGSLATLSNVVKVSTTDEEESASETGEEDVTQDSSTQGSATQESSTQESPTQEPPTPETPAVPSEDPESPPAESSPPTEESPPPSTPPEERGAGDRGFVEEGSVDRGSVDGGSEERRTFTRREMTEPPDTPTTITWSP